MISLTGLVTALVWLIVVGLVFWLCQWLIDYVGLPEPFYKVAKVILAVAAVVAVILVLLSIVNGTPVFRP